MNIWLYMLYNKCKRECINDAVDMISDIIDDLCSDNKLDEINKLLEEIDLDTLDTSCMRKFLSSTSVIKDKLTARKELYKKVKNKIQEKYNDQEITNKILKGLE